MEIDELLEHELLTFMVLAKYLIHADGHVSKDEMLDLMSLSEVFGPQRFMAMLDATKDRYQDPHEVLRMVNSVTRYDARVLIFVLLEELAKGDGVGVPEQATLDELRMRWEL